MLRSDFAERSRMDRKAGGRDRIVPDHWRLSYVTAAEATGEKPVSIGIPEAGHFELIDPTSTAWPSILKQIETLANTAELLDVNS